MIWDRWAAECARECVTGLVMPTSSVAVRTSPGQKEARVGASDRRRGMVAWRCGFTRP